MINNREQLFFPGRRPQRDLVSLNHDSTGGLGIIDCTKKRSSWETLINELVFISHHLFLFAFKLIETACTNFASCFNLINMLAVH